MKVNLMWGQGHPLSGYLNVDPHTFGVEGVNTGDVTDLDGYVNDSEATEILELDIIDFLPLDMAGKAMHNWVKKLRHGGKIVVGGTDVSLVCMMFNKKALDLTQFNKIIHGEQKSGWDFKASHLSIKELAELLEGLGLNILKKRHSHFQMSVEAQRP